MFCKHKWKVIDKAILSSAFEQDPRGINALRTLAPWVYEKKVQVIVACEHCGKIKRYTERNP